MTNRQLPLSRLGQLVPPLVEAQALITLVSMTADTAWAAKAAWDIARIAAKGGRRVALVDLRLDEPWLHKTVGLEPGDGIVDAFEYGVSLAKTAREVHGVFFISAGSDTANAGELYGHPRWRKLQAGFRSEGALLLLFVSPAGLARLAHAAMPDGALVLAPEGSDALLIPGAIPLLGIVRDRWVPSRTSAPVFMPAEPRARPGVRAALVTVGLAAAAVGGWALFAGAREPVVVAPEAPPPPPPAAAPADSGWTIQLAAYGTEENAASHAERLLREFGVNAAVQPAPREAGAPVWYRVLVGVYATREAAGAARDTLWQRGVAPRGIGTLLPRLGGGSP